MRTMWARLLGWEVPESSEYLADRWVIEMNHNNVASAMLVASIPGDVESVGIAVERHAERFHSIVMMNPLMPGADIRCANALRDGQVTAFFCFRPCTATRWRTSMCIRCCRPWRVSPGAVVYVHCGMLSVGFRRKLGLHSPFDMRYSNPIDLQAVCAGVSRAAVCNPSFPARVICAKP